MKVEIPTSAIYYTRVLARVLASRVSGCLLDSLVHEKYLILGKKTPNSKLNFQKVELQNNNKDIS